MTLFIGLNRLSVSEQSGKNEKFHDVFIPGLAKTVPFFCVTLNPGVGVELPKLSYTFEVPGKI